MLSLPCTPRPGNDDPQSAADRLLTVLRLYASQGRATRLPIGRRDLDTSVSLANLFAFTAGPSGSTVAEYKARANARRQEAQPLRDSAREAGSTDKREALERRATECENAAICFDQCADDSPPACIADAGIFRSRTETLSALLGLRMRGIAKRRSDEGSTPFDEHFEFASGFGSMGVYGPQDSIDAIGAFDAETLLQFALEGGECELTEEALSNRGFDVSPLTALRAGDREPRTFGEAINLLRTEVRTRILDRESEKDRNKLVRCSSPASRRGRKQRFDPEADRRIANDWKSVKAEGRTKREFARDRRIDFKVAVDAIKRHDWRARVAARKKSARRRRR